MVNKRLERGLWLIAGLALSFSLLISAAPKSKKSVEEEIQALKEENLKLKQQMEELNAKLDLLLSRIEKLEQAGKFTKSSDSFEESPIAPKEIQGGNNLPIIKVEPKPGSPEVKVIEIIDEDKKKNEAESGKVVAAKDVVGEAKKLMEARKYAEAEKLIQDRLGQKPEAKESCPLYYYLGETQSRAGKSAESARSYLEVSDRYPACEYSAEAMFKSGELYEKMGEKDKARKIYQDIVSLYPFSKYANLAAEKLKK